MSGRLAGKIALVTGASRGNGRAIALAIAREGADVGVNFLTQGASADDVVREIQELGRRAVALRADVREPEQVSQMAEEAWRQLGPVSILVNNAGTLKRTSFLDLTLHEWDEIVDLNLRSYFVVGQAIARRMATAGGGVIVNVSSVLQDRASALLAHYCVSKAGVGMLTRVMALELAKHGIRVNAVCPGTIVTDLNRKDAERPEWVQAQLAKLAVPKFGEPEDLAAAVVFLASDESRMAVGTSLFLDYGRSIS